MEPDRFDYTDAGAGEPVDADEILEPHGLQVIGFDAVDDDEEEEVFGDEADEPTQARPST